MRSFVILAKKKMNKIKTRNKKKIFLMIMIQLCFFMSCPQINYAASKTLSVKLSKEYESCVFNIAIEEKGTYTGIITSPEGERYNCTKIGENLLTCTIKDVSLGSWKIKIKDKTRDNIGKVKVTITANKANESGVVEDIKIGKDIVGLHIYFMDDNLEVEWGEQEQEGSINIKVVDLDTATIIDQQDVMENKYECPIPQNVRTITVTVVPSESQNIIGAEKTFTYTTDNNPDAVVKFPDITETNKDQVSVSVTLNQQYSIYVEEDGECVFEKENVSPGDYNYDIPLKNDGVNKIKFFLVDSEGNMRSSDKTINKDTVAPTFTLDKEYDGISTKETIFTISGKIANYNEFTINDEKVNVSAAGRFEYQSKLAIGNNKFYVIAKDDAGNIAQYNITVERTKQSIVSSGLLAKIVILVMGGAVVFIIVKKKKKKKNNSASEEDPPVLHGDNKIISNSDEKSNKYTWNKKKIVNESPNPPGQEQEQDVNEQKPQNGNLEEPNVKKDRNKGKKKEQNEERKIRSSSKRKDFLNKNLYVVLIPLATFFITYLIFTNIIMIGIIPSKSMEPTLKVKDIILSNRFAYFKAEPKLGDIISFYNKEEKKIYCKRVIGVPGDTISFHDGYVYINNEKLEETYISDDVETNDTDTYTVPDKKIFVLGDNREDSYDSRFWNNPYVDIKDIKAKEFFIIPLHTILN